MEELFYLRANTSLRRYRREKLDGRDYYVVPLSMLAPGVLNGSNGPLYYPKEECSRNVQAWNGMPITVYHPTLNGSHVSARTPKVIEKQGIGFVFAANYRGKLRAEGWVDVEKARRIDNRIVEAIENNRPMELSTGLFTDNEPTKGTWNGRAYDYIARNYRPDHLAFLPDQKGACSISDGCGVLVNKNNGETKVKNPGMLKTLAKVLGLIANECDDEDCDGSCGMKHPKDADEDSEQVDNVFCPTGEGGGVDPTCSPSGTSGAGGGKKSKKKKRLPTASELSEFISADSISRKGDVYTARKQFFYTFGKDAGAFAERIKQSYPGVVVQDFGEVWKPFRGGASTRASSHWWVKFTIKQDEPTENAEGEGVWRTIRGAKVFIEGGKITKGPKALRGKTEAEASGGKSDSSGKGISEIAKSHSVSALDKSRTAKSHQEHQNAAAAHFLAAESNKRAAEHLTKSTDPGSGHEAITHESMRSAHQTMGESHLKAAEKVQSTAGGKQKGGGSKDSPGTALGDMKAEAKRASKQARAERGGLSKAGSTARHFEDARDKHGLSGKELSGIKKFYRGKQTSAEFDSLTPVQQAAVGDIDKWMKESKTNNQDSRSGLSVNQRRKKMTKLTTEQREEIIDRLTANCEECDEDRQIYDGFSDKMLLNLDGKVKAALIANADPDEDDEEEGGEEPARNSSAKQLTEAQFLAMMPDKFKRMVANADKAEAKEKARIITRLTANIKDGKARKSKQEKLSGMDMDQLQTMAELMQVNVEEPGIDPVYAPGGMVGNSREVLVNRQTGEKIDAEEWKGRGLLVPTFNWDTTPKNGSKQPAEAN